MNSGFPQTQAAFVTVAFGERDFGQYDVTVAKLSLRNQGGKSALTEFKYVLGLALYGGGH